MARPDIRNMPKFHGYVRAMVNKSPKPPALLEMLPPMALAETVALDHPQPEPPVLSGEWAKVRELARSASDPNRPNGADQVVRFLRGVDELTWLKVVADAQSWNQYQAGLLLAEPQREPDKVERAKKISRCLYGLPWWLREAHFWREMQSDEKKSEAAPTALRGNAHAWEE